MIREVNETYPIERPLIAETFNDPPGFYRRLLCFALKTVNSTIMGVVHFFILQSDEDRSW